MLKNLFNTLYHMASVIWLIEKAFFIIIVQQASPFILSLLCIYFCGTIFNDFYKV